MLILAGVAINLTLGNNGIFTKAREAKERTEIANVKERVQMDILGERMQNNGNIEDDVLKQILNKYFSDVPEDEEITKDMVLTTKKEYGGEYPIKVSDIYSKNTNQEEGTTASPTESYVGYYADIDGVEGVDGIIFIDLVSGAQGDGQWGDNWGKYTIDTINSSEAKEYYISEETYRPEGTEFEEKPIIKAKNIASNANKKDRFYVMSLKEEVGGKITKNADGTKTIENSPYFCWYDDAFGKLTRSESYSTDLAIGTGKTNTQQMIADWNNDTATYGVQDDGSYIDIWGHIPSTRNDDGTYTVKWFVPSRVEWSAFAGEVLERNTPALTTDNYKTSFRA